MQIYRMVALSLLLAGPAFAGKAAPIERLPPAKAVHAYDPRVVAQLRAQLDLPVEAKVTFSSKAKLRQGHGAWLAQRREGRYSVVLPNGKRMSGTMEIQVRTGNEVHVLNTTGPR